MVRNMHGGNKGKKGARSKMKGNDIPRKLRKKKDGEMYAKVQKMFGNGMAEVLCDDGVIRLLIIRKKFKGRHKRENNVSFDSILLVGKRDWQVIQAGKKEKVDLLFVYSQPQAVELNVFVEEDPDDCGVDFSDDIDVDNI
jgi:translation initiation factor 1A